MGESLWCDFRAHCVLGRSVSNSSAMLFGGKTDANKLFGRVMVR